MRVYDIALMLVRVLVAMDLIRAALDVGYTAIRYTFLINSAASSEWLTKVELSSWLSPIYAFVSALVLYAASKPIARFASRLAASTDTASHF
ncbi:MAG TPA: hypothetical protein VGI95_06115 [Caulobacteraceae bacterium]|jgi:hypothetical protein